MKVFLFALGMFLMCNAILAWCCLGPNSTNDASRRIPETNTKEG